MMDKSNKDVILKMAGLAVVVFVLVYIGIKIISPPDGSLESIMKDIKVSTVTHPKGTVEIQPTSLIDILPEIRKYPPQVNESTPNYIEIFSSPEKAGRGTDGWLTEVAKDFNSAKIMINGRPVSVRLRGIASGQGADYITSGKYLPDAYTPSNELWGEMIASQGVRIQLVQKKLVGNVAGILITKAKKDELDAKYGAINISTIAEAVANNELAMGYTDPLSSSTGLNFLISALHTFDSSDLLGEKAKAGLKSFQANIPVVAHTTLQLRDAATSGVLDGFILEYQTYMNTPDIRSYEFIPFGFRHDSPMYAIGELSPAKMEILNQFVQFSQQEKYQVLANKYGFGGLNEYQSKDKTVSGDVIIRAQKIWKDLKNAGKPICAVFVVDVSGSMEGEPLIKLKRSLLEGQKYIGKDNQVGLISYSNNVHIDLPIAKFDINQRSKFAGAVDDLQAGGSTATFDAIAVAMDLLIKQKAVGVEADPNLKPRIFVLSDGKQNEGHSLEQIEKIVKDLGMPINTIGYNANIPELQKISNINEGVCINADNEDVAYKLSNLFNVEM
jgi:Ca-activated chloride channel homolog